MLVNIFFLSICFFCHWMWLLPLLLGAFLLGWFFEYLKRQKFIDQIEALEKENKAMDLRITEGNTEITNLKYELEKSTSSYNDLRSKNADLDIKLRACNEKKSGLKAQLLAVQNVTTTDSDDAVVNDALGIYSGEETGNHAITTDSTSETLGIAGAFTADNLQIIEGVGPKIERLLKDGGYNNWSALSAAKIEGLQKVLDDAGPRYRVHNPKTWSEQARLAANSDWAALVKYQQNLDTGRDDATIVTTPSKVEKLYAKKIGFASVKLNDMKIIEGVGPKIAGLINAAGIKTWAELAVCPVERIQEILTAAGDRYRLADPTSWPKQAALAADAKWAQLKAYQDALDGGRA